MATEAAYWWRGCRLVLALAWLTPVCRAAWMLLARQRRLSLRPRWLCLELSMPLPQIPFALLEWRWTLHRG